MISPYPIVSTTILFCDMYNLSNNKETYLRDFLIELIEKKVGEK